jgi:hypothetical protein
LNSRILNPASFCGAVVLSIFLIYPLILISILHLTAAQTPINGTNNSVDRFGIKKIYSTKQGGREWFIDMNNPKADGIFSIKSKHNITKQIDGSWRAADSDTRMTVDSPYGAEPWKNVEITGYLKIISVIPRNNTAVNGNVEDNNNTDLDWYARGGRHSSSVPCEGTALHGGLQLDGSVRWKKEIWHTGGYTDDRANPKVITDPIFGRWIGWKAIIYNMHNGSAVKMESYIDNTDTNYWIQVANLTDAGGWYATSPDNEFYSADCGKQKDYVLANPGRYVTFRSDNIVWNFKNLSVREIQPTPSLK